MKLNGKHVILSFVLFVFGYLIAVGYQHTSFFNDTEEITDEEWDRTFHYRQQLIDLEARNQTLQQDINDLRLDLMKMEENFSNEQQTLTEAVELKQTLQAYVGELNIEGEGIFLSLKDQNFVPSEENVNDYIVHDYHIQLVLNELYSAGAEAIAINGQRIYADSHVVCVGPVISVDGKSYPAPFEIEAIGNKDTLMNSLTLAQGVIDELVNDQIEVEYKQMNQIVMEHN
ncbi:uncharacterized protein YlxW (UPF0749 family) [Streptohalobacillus salinus]|uniref:Uncharacterized protein YlxW (UPF0749 family) n=1 Tax=Streptohalobacillus salinus TaxID=621096 RepID=A0A2V3WJ88_9BACI|nr:DUF881 domain-containing protein [Streptohalobacillus salinus]PXW92608.1 uncharacterized protein YlxW (UPF0749 family) [Streptohalobacillus salinus]